MIRLRAALGHIVALFVDDWATSFALIVWLLIAAAVLPRLSGSVAGAALYAGIATILIASVAIAGRSR